MADSVSQLDKLTTGELGRLFPISLVKSDPAWPQLFGKEKARLHKLLGPEKALRIVHFGSTAVQGLAAKPTIDILMEIPDKQEVQQEIRKIMEQADYHFIWRTDHPPPYMMFVSGYTLQGFKGQCIHIHAAPEDHTGLWDRLYFRDYLIDHPGTAKEYEKLKRQLARRHRFNREKYTEGKSAYVKAITTKAKAIYAGSRKR